MNTIEQKVFDLIPVGRERAIARGTLVILSGIPDRELRDIIARLRREEPILNMQNGLGYYRPSAEDREEVERFIKQESSRAKAIFCALYGARKWLKGQKETAPVVAHRDGQAKNNTMGSVTSEGRGCQG